MVSAVTSWQEGPGFDSQPGQRDDSLSLREFPATVQCFLDKLVMQNHTLRYDCAHKVVCVSDL